jgi:hypothetical protein
LQYASEMGKHEQAIIAQAIRNNRPIPERIANAPELLPGLEIYLQAFFDLDSERSHAMGPTAIPWTSIVNYARAFDFDEEQTEDLIYLIKRMDAENLKEVSKKQKEATKKSGKNARRFS